MSRVGVRRVVAAALGVVLVLVVGAGGCSGEDGEPGGAEPSSSPSPSTSGSEEPSTAPSEPETPPARDWLAPASEIKVGQHRYVSACQVVGKDDVEALLGPMSDTASIREHYVDASRRPAGRLDTLPVRSSCFHDEAGVSVDVEQHYTVADARELDGSIIDLSEEDTAKVLRRSRAAAAEVEDPELADFVQQLVRSDRTRRTAESGTPIRAGQAARMVFPIDSFAGGLSAVVVHDNVVVTLDLTDPTTSEDSSTWSSPRLRMMLDYLSQLVDVVRERLADPGLSQSPTATLLGEADTVGSTPLLEACAVLDRKTFTQITGKEVNRDVYRTTLPVAPKVNNEGRNNFPSNSCARQRADSTALFSGTNTYVTLSLSYAATAKGHLRVRQRSAREEPQFNQEELSTDADWATRVDGGGFDVVVYHFGVGPYAGRVSTYTSVTEGGVDLPTRDNTDRDHVRAINLIVKSLRRNQKLAQQPVD